MSIKLGYRSAVLSTVDRDMMLRLCSQQEVVAFLSVSSYIIRRCSILWLVGGGGMCDTLLCSSCSVFVIELS